MFSTGSQGFGGQPGPPPEGSSDQSRRSPKSDKDGNSSSPGGTKNQPGDGVHRLSPKSHGPMKARRPGQTTMDIPSFTKDKSPSGDSGYWTSPTNTMGKPLKASSGPSRQVQEVVKEEEDPKHHRRSAIFDRPEKLEKKLKSPVKSRDISEESKAQGHDEASAQKRIATILDQKRSPPSMERLSQKDIKPTMGYALQFKSTPSSISNTDSDSFRKSEDMDKKKLDLSSRIPVFVRKDGSKPPSPTGTKSEMELTYTLCGADTRAKEIQDKVSIAASSQAVSMEKNTDAEPQKERRISCDLDKPRQRKSSTELSSGRSSRKSSLTRRQSDAGSKHSGNESSSSNTSPSNTKELSINLDGDQSSPVLMPKPPDGPTSPRKPSIGRRNSFKKKDALAESSNQASASEQPKQSTDGDVKASKSVAEQLKVSIDKKTEPTATNSTPITSREAEPVPSSLSHPSESAKCSQSNAPADDTPKTDQSKPSQPVSSADSKEDDLRGRKESRHKRDKTERRASSLGAIMSRLNGGNTDKNVSPKPNNIVIDKPPIGKMLITRDKTPERRSTRRRTKSEQGNITSSEDEGDGSGSGKVVVKVKSGEKDGTYGVHAVVRRPSRKDKDATTSKGKIAVIHKRYVLTFHLCVLCVTMHPVCLYFG